MCKAGFFLSFSRDSGAEKANKTWLHVRGFFFGLMGGLKWGLHVKNRDRVGEDERIEDGGVEKGKES